MYLQAKESMRRRSRSLSTRYSHIPVQFTHGFASCRILPPCENRKNAALQKLELLLSTALLIRFFDGQLGKWYGKS